MHANQGYPPGGGNGSLDFWFHSCIPTFYFSKRHNLALYSPHAPPHSAGLLEAGVKSAKTIFEKWQEIKCTPTVNLQQYWSK